MTTRLDDAYRIHVVRHEGKDCLVVGWLCELSKDEADKARKGPAEAERVFAALLEQAHAERPVRAATSDSGIDKEEYQTLRKEVETAMSELNTLETAGLVAVAGIFAWLFANAGKLPDSAAWYIPSVLVAMCCLRALMIGRHLGLLGNYIRRLETRYLQPRVQGWEHFLAAPRWKGGITRRSGRGMLTGLFWIILLGATLYGVDLGVNYAPDAAAGAQDRCPVVILANAAHGG